MISAPNDLVAIPPKVRTVIYYVLALSLVVVGALVQAGRLDALYLVITSGVAGVFFGVAGSNVSKKATPVNVEIVGEGGPGDPDAPQGGVWGGG